MFGNLPLGFKTPLPVGKVKLNFGFSRVHFPPNKEYHTDRVVDRNLNKKNPIINGRAMFSDI